MRTERKFTSFIIQSVENWLATLSGNLIAPTKQEAQLAIYHVTEALGYGEPFDREQKAINALLIDKWANEKACQTAWNFYHEIRYVDLSLRSLSQKNQRSYIDISVNTPPL